QTSLAITRSLHDALPISLQLLNEKDSLLTSVKTNEKGLFTFDKVPKGQYRLSSSILGYKSVSRGVNLTGAPVTINYQLEPSEIRSEEHTSELQSRENLVC